jgi:hypothetical protein
MHDIGSQVKDDEQEIGIVHKIIQSPIDPSIVVLLGSTGINYITQDCGAEIRALNSGKKINEFSFHPTQKNWALAASWTICQDYKDENCKVFKELYFTMNLGGEWRYLTNYVFDFEWGQSKHAVQRGIEIPDERIFVTRDNTAKTHQIYSKRLRWSSKINLEYSDNFFASSDIILYQGNTIIKTPQFMFVAVSYSEQRIKIYSANYESGFIGLKQARLPRDAEISNTFTLMDTSEEQVFLFIDNRILGTPFGNLYISDEKGRTFTLSMSNVVRMNGVDFEKISSLDGTFIANRYNVDIPAFDRYKWNERDKTGYDYVPEKSPPTKQEVRKDIRSYITHNKGGSWELIPAPKFDSKGEATNCDI